jgi:hypothetical protein
LFLLNFDLKTEKMFRIRRDLRFCESQQQLPSLWQIVETAKWLKPLDGRVCDVTAGLAAQTSLPSASHKHSQADSAVWADKAS